ncbi:MAG: hypothetical protein LBT64_02245 [Puniceicoccales bacterium]|nr:hypothetical protein [Puniceicoccales bacterium]
MQDEVKLDAMDPIDVAFDNLFVGSERRLTFESGPNRYSIFLKPKNIGLDAKILLKVKIAAIDAEILLCAFSDLGKINEKFAGIDLMLFDDELKAMLLNCLLEQEIAAFSAKVGIGIQMQGAFFSVDQKSAFDREVGVNILRNDTDAVTFNVRLGRDLLKILNSKFEKIEASTNDIDPNLPLEWYLEVGRTNLSPQTFQNLEEYDIIFLDDDSSVKSGRYEIKGLEDMKLIGKLSGCNLVLECGNLK